MPKVSSLHAQFDRDFVPAESLVLDVARSVLEKYEYKLTVDAQKAAIGRRPLEAWQATIDALGMQNTSAQQLFDESEHLLKLRSAYHPRHDTPVIQIASTSTQQSHTTVFSTG